MSSTRSKTKSKEGSLILSGKTKNYQKHIVCVLDDTPAMKRQAEAWVNLKNRHYQIINPTTSATEEKPYYVFMEAKKDSKSKFLETVEPDTILYLYCHGFITNPNEDVLAINTKLWIKNFDSNDSKKVKEYKPVDLLNLLSEQGLSAHHKTLKIAACYSDKFAEGLSRVSHNAFPELTVYGYSGQLIVAQGRWGGKLAGFDVEGTDSMLVGSNGHYSLNTAKFNLISENLDIYRAKNFRSGYKAGIKLEEKLEEKQSKQVTNSNASQINQSIQSSSSIDNTAAAVSNSNDVDLQQPVSRANVWPSENSFYINIPIRSPSTMLSQLNLDDNAEISTKQTGSEIKDKSASDDDIIDSNKLERGRHSP